MPTWLRLLPRSFLPPRSPQLSKLFKVPLNPDGFFQEAHVKLRPVDFAAEGVFLCGTAHYPKHMTETISQAYGAAGRVIGLLSKNSVTATGAICDVNEYACVACGGCISACTYDAIEFYGRSRARRRRSIRRFAKVTVCVTPSVRRAPSI